MEIMEPYSSESTRLMKTLKYFSVYGSDSTIQDLKKVNILKTIWWKNVKHGKKRNEKKKETRTEAIVK